MQQAYVKSDGIKYSSFLISLSRASPVSRDIPAKADLLSDKAAGIGVAIKE